VSNVLSEEKKQEVVALGRLGWSLRRIQKAVGVRRETASGYLKGAGIAIRPPGGWGWPAGAKPAIHVITGQVDPAANPAIKVITDSAVLDRRTETVVEPSRPKPAIEVTTDSDAASAGTAAAVPELQPGRSPSASACVPYREAIELGLARGRNAMAIWQDLVDQCGFAAGYQSVRRFVRHLQANSAPEPRAVIATPVGEEAQVDYGSGPMVRDPQSGKYRRTRLFVLTLGFSRKSVRLLTFRSSSQIWAELHEKAFRRLGGASRVVVLDNLREGVITPDIYDPALNPLYRDVLTHYGAVALPCRVRDPDRKGKVEAGVAHAQKTPLKGLRFENMQDAQAYLDHWEERWADTRIHGTTKRQVAAMFAEERPTLLALPLEPFRYYQYGERTVHLDGCVEVEAAYYSAPPGWIGRRVQVQWDTHQVRLLDPRTGQLLREHLRHARGCHRIKEEDRPKRIPLTTQQLLLRADRAGAQIGALCRGMHASSGELAVRHILGVLSLAKKYGGPTVDDACAAALEMGACQYRFVRRYLERRPQAPLSLRQVDPLIRQLTLYRDFIQAKTEENQA
jgi:transposase